MLWKFARCPVAKNKDGRPEWFKFWRRNRKQIDIDRLGMESRGIVFTNMMRYFDHEELVEMSDVEYLAFNVLAVNIDEAFEEYEARTEVNRENGSKGGRPRKDKTGENQKNQMGFKKPTRTEKTRSENSECRMQKTEVDTAHAYGEYKWVKLTDSQYAKLQQDLGQSELDRCIRYVDESAQQTGNKNKWRDWNLVIRRCHRDGWGLPSGNKDVNTAADHPVKYYHAEDDNDAF